MTVRQIDSSTIDILSLIQQRAPIQLHGRPTNSKDGHEYHSSCPWCGGVDRFAIWPDIGRWSCKVRSSGCGRWGDAIGFLMQWEDMSYYQACQELDIDPRYPEDAHSELPLFMTKDEAPNKKWMEAAELFVWRAERYLWTEGGKRGLDYLHSRGLTDDTLRRARIGFCPDWFREPLQNWGLSFNQTGQEEEIKIPLGVVIPWFVDGKPWKISVRRPDKSYFQVLGSSDALYNLDTLQPGQAVFLFESEFDALSAQQEAGDLAAMIATGGAGKGQTTPLRLKLKQASHLLVAFDNDTAGDEGSKYWLKTFPNAIRWLPWRHDINELLQQQAILVRMWAELGLKAAMQEVVHIPNEISTKTPDIPTKEANVPTIAPALSEIANTVCKKKQRPPWVKVNDAGLLEFCSIDRCRERAIAWRSNISFEEAYCKKHIPQDFGWQKQFPLVQY